MRIKCYGFHGASAIKVWREHNLKLGYPNYKKSLIKIAMRNHKQLVYSYFFSNPGYNIFFNIQWRIESSTLPCNLIFYRFWKTLAFRKSASLLSAYRSPLLDKNFSDCTLPKNCLIPFNPKILLHTKCNQPIILPQFAQI